MFWGYFQSLHMNYQKFSKSVDLNKYSQITETLNRCQDMFQYFQCNFDWMQKMFWEKVLYILLVKVIDQ